MEHQIERSEYQQMMVMVFWIAIIHFVVEALIMGMMSGWSMTRDVVSGAILDATLLTVISSPLIYFLVSRPFIQAARVARSELAKELRIKDTQAAILENALADLKSTADLNDALSQRLQRSNKIISEIYERIVQQIGADLHDGPAQLLTYCLLRMEKLKGVVQKHGDPASIDELTQMRSALSDTLTELREISQGLALPKLGALPLKDAIALAITAHQERTNSRVELAVEAAGDRPVPQSVKVCVYRFVQEGLNNAYKHAWAKGQTVRAVIGNELSIHVCDCGPGFDAAQGEGSGLGLLGLRARVEAIGGQFMIESGHDAGTTLTMTLDLDGVPTSDGYHE